MYCQFSNPRTQYSNIAVIGNVGVGKSSFIMRVEKELRRFTSETIQPYKEPVEIWTSYGPKKENCLQKMYENLKEEAFYFQMMAAITKAQQLNSIGSPGINLIERTFECQSQVFIPSLKMKNLISEKEETLLNDLLITYMKQEKNQIDLYILIQTSIENSLKRIKKRGRVGEHCVTSEYLSELNILHKDWINELKKTKPVLYVQTDDDLTNEEIQNIVQQILRFHNSHKNSLILNECFS